MNYESCHAFPWIVNRFMLLQKKSLNNKQNNFQTLWTAASLSRTKIRIFHIVKDVCRTERLSEWVHHCLKQIPQLYVANRNAFLLLIPLGKSFSSFILHLIHFWGQKEEGSKLLLSRSQDIMEKKRHGFGDADHRTHSSAEAAVPSSPGPQQLLFRWHHQFHLLDYECTIL